METGFSSLSWPKRATRLMFQHCTGAPWPNGAYTKMVITFITPQGDFHMLRACLFSKVRRWLYYLVAAPPLSLHSLQTLRNRWKIRLATRLAAAINMLLCTCTVRAHHTARKMISPCSSELVKSPMAVIKVYHHFHIAQT